MIRCVLLLVALVSPGLASADCVALVGGQVLSGGTFSAANLVMRDGRVVAVAAQVPTLAGDATSATFQGRPCQWVDVGGAHVTPGFIEANTQLGLVEVSLESGTDRSDAGGDPVRAAYRAIDGYNPDSVVLPIQRAWGVTAAVVHPVGGLVAGQLASVALYGPTRASAALNPMAGMRVDLDGDSSGMALRALDQLLEDARTFSRVSTPLPMQGQPFADGADRADLVALATVLAGQQPLVVHVDGAAEIEGVLAVAAKHDVKLVVVGGAEAWRLADQLASSAVPVVVDAYVNGPGSFAQLAGREDNAALLAAAGVPLILSSFDTHNARNLRQFAANAVRAGLPEAVALNAITASPATVFGLADRGALAPGAIADVVVWRGHPLELSSYVEALYLSGAPSTLEHRQRALFEKYR